MNRDYFVKCLELIKPALASGNMVPIFQCFNFMNGTVSAYDGAIAIVGPSEFEGTAGIHGNTLFGLLANSGVEEIDFELKNDTAVVTAGKTVARLPFYPEDNFIWEIPDDKWDFEMAFTEGIFEAFKLCLETVSSDETQAALLGITIMGDRLYSCNGDALTRTQIKKGVGKNRALMSTKFCSAVIKLWSTLSMTKGIIKFSNDWVHADLGDWSVYGRVLEIKDPIDFEALIKKGLKENIPTQAIPTNLADALARARVLADPESKKTVIEIVKGRMKLVTETHMGEIKDDLPFKGHPDAHADVNASHLQQALKNCDQIAFQENCTVFERPPTYYKS